MQQLLGYFIIIGFTIGVIAFLFASHMATKEMKKQKGDSK